MSIEEIVENIINDLLENQLTNYKLNLDSYFFGINSEIDSIDIVSSIAFIEDELEKNNIILIDLFDKIFENQELSFRLLTTLIIDLIDNK